MAGAGRAQHCGSGGQERGRHRPVQVRRIMGTMSKIIENVCVVFMLNAIV